ncbi:hypothetical protein [Quadrisphaera granulorum]|uniref:hypothetical protein n=1 Tax=Quadrisphaera granulorum TaxID=317664 RepID=UPI001FE77ABB|nr:hypothetical protein [Quadrisphaera granulorum]
MTTLMASSSPRTTSTAAVRVDPLRVELRVDPLRIGGAAGAEAGVVVVLVAVSCWRLGRSAGEVGTPGGKVTCRG